MTDEQSEAYVGCELRMVGKAETPNCPVLWGRLISQ